MLRYGRACVRQLASIYRLASSEQGSKGKKAFVVVRASPAPLLNSGWPVANLQNAAAILLESFGNRDTNASRIASRVKTIAGSSSWDCLRQTTMLPRSYKFGQEEETS